MTKQQKDWNVYCEKTFNNLRSNAHNWNKTDEWCRAITRDFYLGVFDSGNPNASGLISESAFVNKINGVKTVHDHCYSPQFIGRMVMDNQDMYLNDLETFRKIFFYSCRTIIVTQKENEELSYLTTNDDEGFRVFAPTHLKYKHLGIDLYQRPKGRTQWKYAQPVESNILQVLPEHKLYEKQFLVVEQNDLEIPTPPPLKKSQLTRA